MTENKGLVYVKTNFVVLRAFSAILKEVTVIRLSFYYG
ncbi:hypothetical protein IMCC1989_155 [gamma proteobacterium IMCC1989]|nr:hypothetical protein IMCC1989_155 [gamma proteobacterium IMCC1989]